MDSKLPPTRLPEDLVQSQTPSPAQQFAPRNPVGQPVGQPQLNPIGRRPSITYSTGEVPVRAAPPPQTLQRLDSRQSIPLQPQQPYQNTNQVPVGQLQQPRIIQQRPIGAPTPQPQYQQPPQQQTRIENPNRPQLINRVPAPNLIQSQPINRPAIPPGAQFPPPQQKHQPQQQQQPQQQLPSQQQQLPSQQQQLPSQQQQLPSQQQQLPSQQQQLPSQQQQLPPQQQTINRLPLNRPPLPQTQVNPTSTGYQPIQQGPVPSQQPVRVAGAPQLAPNQYSVTSANSQQNQNIRLNQPGQYRVPQPQQFQAPIQPRPPANTFINPSQKLPTHLEERAKMATEINAGEKHQPSYIISNSDDVDDVIVRPITQSTIFKNDADAQPKVQQAQQPFVGQQQPPQRPQANVAQSEFRQSPQQQQVPIARPPTTSPPNAPSVLKSSTPEPASRSSIPRPSDSFANGQKYAEPTRPTAAANPAANEKKPTPDNSAKKQNGSTGKAEEKGNDDGASAGRLSQSRASSHKSQEDVMQRSSSRSRMLKLLEKPAEPPKKVSMNKIKVGNAPPPNLRQVRSKIGSLDNATHKPGGGNIKIETKKLDFKVQPRIEAKNDSYAPKGGDKKIISTKLQWNAKSKIGSLENANHKPGGGDKKILTIKSDFRENAKPKSDMSTSLSLSASMSLPAECLVLSVTSPSSLKMRRQSGDGSLPGIVRAFHPRPFKLY